MRQKTKATYLAGGSEEGQAWSLKVDVSSVTSHFSGRFNFNLGRKDKKQRRKIVIRQKDRQWVFTHIPSSIHWHTEIHHDWENGARMYLLSHKEHLLRDRRTP